MVFFVLAVNQMLGRPALESLLFAVALAVGISPELLPAIVSVTLARGARAMYADLLVLGQADPSAVSSQAAPPSFVESVLIGSGRPALILPHAGVLDVAAHEGQAVSLAAVRGCDGHHEGASCASAS